MKKLLMTFCTLAAGYTATMMVIAPSDADAADRRMGAGYCRAYNPTQIAVLGGSLYNLNGSTIEAYCTIPSDSYLSHASVNTLNIHGYKPGGAGMWVEACAQDWGSEAFACGYATYPTDYHFNTTVTDLSVWKSNPYWFPLVMVYFPNQAKIDGLWIST